MVNYDNSGVRRQDRLLDEQTSEELLSKSEYGVLSMIETRGAHQAAYGIPINYVWDSKHSIYLHCAPEGHKLECADSNPLVCFVVVGQTQVISNKFTTAYESLVIRGRISRGLSQEERMVALELLLDKYSPLDKEVGLKYTAKSFHRTEILRIEIDSVSGKTKRITP